MLYFKENSKDQIEKLTVPIIVTRPLPENVKEEEKVFFTKESIREIPACFLYKYTNVCLLEDGTIFKNFIPNKKSFVSLLPNHRLHNTKGLLKLYFTRIKVNLPNDSNYIVMHDAWSGGYFHWLTDFLPRLFLVKEALKSSILLIPEKFKERFHKECLALFDIKQIVYLEENVIYRLQELHFVSHIAHMGDYHPQVLSNFTSFFKSQIKKKEDRLLNSKIYISRKNATKRKIINEEEVIKVVRKYNFSIEYFEDLSFLDQVAICSKAQYLISIHGAGLTNMMFMSSGGSVLELKKRDSNINYFFYTLAASAGLKYYYQFCNALNEELSVQDADIDVEIGTLEANIERMLRNDHSTDNTGN